MELHCGAPAEKRQPNEQAVYDFLDHCAIPFTRVDHPPVHTMEDCLAADAVLQVQMCKNLFLCNSQKTKFYLLLLPGNKPFKTKVFSKMMGVSRLSFAPPEKMEEYLHISPGAVSPMGLVFDSAKDVTLVMDEDVKKMNKYSAVLAVYLLLLLILPIPLGHWLGWGGLVVYLLIFALGMVYALRVEKLKKSCDVQTYREIAAFMDGKRLDEIEKQREIGKRPYQKVLIFFAAVLLSAAVTAFMLWLLT